VGGLVFLLSVLLAVLADADYVLIIGTLLAGLWLSALGTSPEHSAAVAPVFPQPLRRRLLLACIAVLVLVHLVHPWFLAASMSGSNRFAENLALVPTILSSTHQGKLWHINSFALTTLFAATLFAAASRKTVVTGITIASLVLIAFAKAASGHAADQGDFTLTELSQLLHILSTAVWAGAVLISGFLVLPRLTQPTGTAALWIYGGRLSKTVTWALIALLISGIYAADRELNNSLADLWTSAWGRILLTKIAFVLIALVLGAVSRFLCLQRAATGKRAALLVRLLFTEAVVMLLVLCLSGLLANTAPAMANM
jgi:putative copper resistance protein D